MNYDIEKAVCFTGHRVIKNDFDYGFLENAVENLIEEGYCTFLIGMAIGFDMLCFSLLLKLKQKYNHIKIIACVPCKDQAVSYGREKRTEYEKFLSVADEVITLYPSYNEFCMKERNRYMVDNSSVCVTYLYRMSGGTYYTTSYAFFKNKKIIYIK